MKNFLKLIVPFFYGTDKKYARWSGLLLILLSQLSTSFGYFFIQWNRRFYDALEAKNSEAFFHELLVFVGIAVSFVLVFSMTRYIGQQFALRWRMWMTDMALSKWLTYEQRGELEGADQRIQEDLMRFTLIFERFFLDSFNAILLILLFIPLLVSQTQGMQIFGLPLGLIIIAASVVYTLVGMFVSAKIANPLINLEYDNQKLEAELRYNLVHAKDGATKTHGFFNGILQQLTNNYQLIYSRQKNFNLWQKGYDQLSFVIPFLLLASSYFAGLLTLGMLMQIKSTFSRIRNSMAYLLDNYAEFTELLAISKRLVEFYETSNIDMLNEPRIELSTNRNLAAD